MQTNRVAFRFVLVILAVLGTGAATVMGLKLGYGLLVLYVVAGCSLFVVFLSVMVQPRVRSARARTRLRAADPGFESYMMEPTHVYPGYCWQCGRRVKVESVVCLGCGATAVHAGMVRRDQAEASAPAVDVVESAPWEVVKPRFSGGMTRWEDTDRPPVGMPMPPVGMPMPRTPQRANPWQQAVGRAVGRAVERTVGRATGRAAGPPPPSSPQRPRSPAERVAPRYRPGAPPPWMQPRPPSPPSPPPPARRRRRSW